MIRHGSIRARNTDGQALVLVALMLGMLMALIVGVNALALARRTQTRIQDSLDQAAVAATTRLETASLATDTPQLNPVQAEATFRATLQSGLTRVATAISPDPATLAAAANVQIVPAGASCQGHTLTAPAVCASLTVTMLGLFGPRTVTFSTLAETMPQPASWKERS